MENLRIIMPDTVLSGFKPFQTPLLNLSYAVQQQNIASDSVAISSVANMIQEAAQSLNGSEITAPVQESVDGIDAEYINTIIELGKAVPKGDETVDDLSWGLTVKLGIDMGIEDADVLRELKLSDVDAYFYEAAYKKTGLESGMKRFDENGGVIVYDNPADIWKDMFRTDEEGNFIKDAHGNAVRNGNFTQARMRAQGPDVSVQSIQGDVWEFGDYKGRLADASSGFLQNLLLGVSSNDPFMYRYTREQATDKMPTWSEKTTAKMDESEKVNFYIKQLSYSYSLLKSSMINAPTVQSQMDELKNLMKGAEWERVKPGGGMTGYFIGSR